MTTTFGVELKQTDVGVRVEAWGELDIASVGAFDECVEAAFAVPAQKVVVDLQRVEFADTRAAGSLGRAAARALVEHRELVL